MPTDSQSARVALADLSALVRRALGAHGADAANAAAVAANMCAVEAGGGRSHGVFRLAGHVAMLSAGQVNGRARPTLRAPAPAALLVEGDDGFAPGALALGLPALAERARATGIAVLGLRRVVHYSALWPEVEALAADGLIGLAATTTPAYVAPAGGRRALFGTDPMAFAWPRAGGTPVVWDQAAAAMARGEILLAARAGRPVPPGVGVDAEGRASTDPAAILDGGAQLPFAGHKGSAIALMIELLAGALLDEVTSHEAGHSAGAGGPVLGGEIVIAIDPGALAPGARVGARAERLLAALAAEDGVRLPGARRPELRAAAETGGVAIEAGLLAEIRALAG